VGALPGLRVCCTTAATGRRDRRLNPPDVPGVSRGTREQCAAADPRVASCVVSCVETSGLTGWAERGRAPRPTAAGSDAQTDRAAHPAAAAFRCGARRPGCLDVSRGTGGSVPAFAGSGHPAVVSDGGGAAVPADCRLSIRLARFHVKPRRSSAALLLSPADPDARTGRMFHVEPEVVSGGMAPSDSDARTGPSRKRAQRSAPALRSSPPDAHSLQVLGGAAPVLEGRRRETRTFGRGGCFTWNRRPCLVRRRPGT
jgi:hypothetical protein